MSGSHPMRWIAFLLCGALSVLGCVGSTDSPQGETGALSLDLVIGDGILISEVDWRITGNGMNMSGEIDVSAPGSTASVEVFGLPPGEEDYRVMLTATSVDEDVTCEGSAPFNVEVGHTTNVMVMLNCKKPRTLGGVRVNGKFNICTQLTKVVVSPLRTSVGNDISLSAQAFDEEGDEIHYIWSGDGGSIAAPSAASTTYTCQEVGQHMVTILVTDNDVYCRMATWTVPVTCVPGDVIDLCEDVECPPDGNQCTEAACEPSSGECVSSNVDDGTLCEIIGVGDGICFNGQCVEIDLCEDVECNDDNECTNDACDPVDGECDFTNVDNGTSCADDTGMCIDGACVVIIDKCQGVVCDDTGNDCTVAMCNTATGICDTMNVTDGTECNAGAGACSAGVCIDNNLCNGVDCTSANDCVQDGTCDPLDGQCIAGDDEPADTACNADSGDVCDGNGACVECNSADQCPVDGNACTVAACESNACAQNNVMDGEACDFDGSAGICEAGTCIAAPECISPGDCIDGNPCTIGLCADGICSFDPVAGGSCDPGSGSGDGTCSNTGTCVSNDECTANTDCSDDDGNECTVPVCVQTGAPYVCDEDSAPADGNECEGGSGTCQDGVCEGSDPVISEGSGDTGWRAAPILCSDLATPICDAQSQNAGAQCPGLNSDCGDTPCDGPDAVSCNGNCLTDGKFEFIDGPSGRGGPRAGCEFCLSDSCAGGTNNGRACTVDGDCPSGQCNPGTPDPPDCALDCFTFTCFNVFDPPFILPAGAPLSAAVYPGQVEGVPIRGCEVVSGTLKNQLAIDTIAFLDVNSDGANNLTTTYNIQAANAGLALAGPLANLFDVTIETLVIPATPAFITQKLDPALQNTPTSDYITAGVFTLTPAELPPVPQQVIPDGPPSVTVNFDPAGILIELVIVSNGAPLDITGDSCTFQNPAGTCIGGLNDLDVCDPTVAPPGDPTCLASNPITAPGTCKATGGADITLDVVP